MDRVRRVPRKPLDATQPDRHVRYSALTRQNEHQERQPRLPETDTIRPDARDEEAGRDIEENACSASALLESKSVPLFATVYPVSAPICRLTGNVNASARS